jgi:transcriptional regulator with XRE-family HTH domain
MAIRKALLRQIKLRRSEGTSLHEISIKSGVSYGSLYRFVYNNRNISLNVVDKLALFLGVAVYLEE